MLVIRPLHISQNHVLIGSFEVQTPGGFLSLRAAAMVAPASPGTVPAFNFPTEEFAEEVSGNLNAVFSFCFPVTVAVERLISIIDVRPTPLPCEKTYEMMLNEMR